MLDLDHIFTHHPPDAEDVYKYQQIRNAAKNLAEVIVKNTPPSADQSAAIRLLRESVFTANASIALKGRLDVYKVTGNSINSLDQEPKPT